MTHTADDMHDDSPVTPAPVGEVLPPAFITSTSDAPKYYVTVKTQTLKDAQRWHDAILELQRRGKAP